MRKSLFLISLMVLLFLSSNAGATQLDFSFTGPVISGSGTLDAIDNGDGTYSAMSGDVVFSAGYVYSGSLVSNPSPPGQVLAADGQFLYDDQLDLSGGPYLTNSGLLFTNGTEELNIYYGTWSTAGPYEADFLTSPGDYTPAFAISEFNASAAPVPEPATMLLLGSGLIGMAGFGRKKLFKKA